jgi:hypothetical protein
MTKNKNLALAAIKERVSEAFFRELPQQRLNL